MAKKIFLSIATLFLAWQSFKILSIIEKVEVDSWLLIIFIAWIINLFITGVFALSGFAFPTQKLLPKAYYQIYNSRRLKYFYKTLRVDLFRLALLATLWKSQKQRQKYFNGKKDGISNLIEQSMKSEFGHLIPFILLSLVSIYMLIIGITKIGLATLFINIVGNLYPVILQRYHRMRIQIIEKKQLRNKNL